jgi:hypothetical protein
VYFLIALRTTPATLLWGLVISFMLPRQRFSICANVDRRSLLHFWQFVVSWWYYCWMFPSIGRTFGLAATVNCTHASDFLVRTSVSILFNARLASSAAKVAPCFSFFREVSVFRPRMIFWIR